jgi:hypothetical protein
MSYLPALASRHLRLCGLGLAIGPLTAQIPIGGSQSGTLPPGIYTTNAPLSVNAGQTWTLSAGVIIKFTAVTHAITVAGALVSNGTAGNPVILTDFRDDSAGGDTNGDGPSSGSVNSWRGLVFSSSPNNVLNYTEVRYTGAFNDPSVTLVSSSPTLDHCVIRNSGSNGLRCDNASFPTVTDCLFANNGSYAVESVSLAAMVTWSGNIATGNGNNYALVTQATLTSNLTLTPAMMLGGAFVLNTSIDVQSGAVLTLQAGSILKMTNVGVQVPVTGRLQCNGTASNPVILTDLRDDSAGGDTNGDGPSSGSVNSWRGLVFSSSANSVLNYTEVRYTGAFNDPSVTLVSSSPTLDHCVIRNSGSNGLRCDNASFPIIKDCRFSNNGSWPIDNVDIGALANFVNNTANGNGASNAVRVTTGTVAGAVTIQSQSMMGGAHVLATSVAVPASSSLTFLQGVVLKAESVGVQINASGALNWLGTSYEPVVFTGFADDSVGGDTNNDGPSVGSPNSHREVSYNAGATGLVEHTVVRFAGAFNLPGFVCNSGNVDLRCVRLDRCGADGFILSAAAGTVANLVAWGCGGNGIQLTGGGFHLAHATCNGNGTGIRREAAWTGNVINSISRGNATNFSNFGTGTQVLASNGGFAGNNGNLDVDPLFVNDTQGDLRLQPGSPCLGVADVLPAVQAAKDFDENSRLLDHGLVGSAMPDMGAFELARWNMNVVGSSRIGTSLDYTITGETGASFFLFGNLDGTAPALPYGIVLCASQASSIVFLTSVAAPTTTPFTASIPNNPILVGVSAGMQTVTLSALTPGFGQLTRMHRLLVRP